MIVKITNLLFNGFILTAICILFSFSDSNITNCYAQSLNEKVIGEGILEVIYSANTHEISNPSGYAIKFPIWIISPIGANSTVYLRTNKTDLRTMLGKRIRFEGKYFKVPFKKYSNISFSNPYDEVQLDTIYVIK
jgi:hypothetical protein